MADKNVQLHDASGNDLYPKTKAGNLTGTLGVANGGTGQASIPAFLNAIATEYTNTGTVTGETQYHKDYTVNGSGLVYAVITTSCDTTNSYGSVISEIFLNDAWVAEEYNRTDSRSGAGVAACASIMMKVQNGDEISFLGFATKGGTKTIKIRVLAFGCTLTAQ